MACVLSPASAQARLSYLGISVFVRRQQQHIPVSSKRASSSGGTYRRSDFTNQPYTGRECNIVSRPKCLTTYRNIRTRRSYRSKHVLLAHRPVQLTHISQGPLRDAYTPPRITPTVLKAHLDAFVVGQDRAKRVLATAVYNHYQRINELQRREDEEEELLAQEERRRMAQYPRHPVEGRQLFRDGDDGRAGIHVPALTRMRGEDEFPGQTQTTTTAANTGERANADPSVGVGGWKDDGGRNSGGLGGGGPPPLYDPTPLTIEKSNVLLLGPSGVGKTLMAKTLARVLEVPFSMSDCTPFTQAGYIGEDAEVCVQRLLAAANYDVARAERGIICLDEIDKIATAKVSHGKDVSGEGVQQALLKIIEGTTLQIQAKSERGSGPPPSSRSGMQHGFPPGSSPTNSPLSSGGGGSSPQSVSGGQKGETYNVKTDNILFICAGAFNGLHKIVLDRISKGSIGFGAPVRASVSSSSTTNSTAANSALHTTTLTSEETAIHAAHLPFDPNQQHQSSTDRTFPTLDLLTPPDLQTYGLLPELTGRLPITTSLTPLSLEQLVQVLTEPRNALLKQYKSLFSLSHIDLRFSLPALHAVARRAEKMGTGARALRTVMEGVLAEAMFEGPGSGVRFVVVNEAVVEGRERVGYFVRGQGALVERLVGEEERLWREKHGLGEEVRGVGSFEEYRGRIGAVGSS